MTTYILKRIGISLFLLWVMSFITFMLMRLTPGNFIDTLRMDPQISPETLMHYTKLYQLDKPALVQYVYWLKGFVVGEFGYSFYYNIPVSSLIASRLFNTFILSFSAFLMTWMIAIPLGVWAALHRGRWMDRMIQCVSYIFLSMPSFFIAMILLFWASQWGFLPLGGMQSVNAQEMLWYQRLIDILKHLIIPTIALSLGSIAALSKIMRGNMLEVLGKQYVLSARAKGLPEHRVIYVHALRNALNPLMTLLGYELAGLLSGAALIEMMTSWPGLGSLMLTAVRSKDMYVVMASMMMGGGLFVLGNLMADLLLFLTDPRIKQERT